MTELTDQSRGKTERGRERNDVGAKKKGVKRRRGRTQHHFEHGAVRVPWPFSGPKPRLEFPRIVLCGLDSLTDIAFFYHASADNTLLFWRKSNFCEDVSISLSQKHFEV